MVTLTIATFALVFLRAWQQQNVIHGWYIWAAVTSYALALADVLVLLGVVHHGLPAVPWVGTGGALGVTAAMFLHRRMKR
jgi:hypothetical protein